MRPAIEDVEDLRRFFIVPQLKVCAGNAAQCRRGTLNLKALPTGIARAGVVADARIGLTQNRKPLRVGGDLRVMAQVGNAVVQPAALHRNLT